MKPEKILDLQLSKWVKFDPGIILSTSDPLFTDNLKQGHKSQEGVLQQHFEVSFSFYKCK